MYLPISQCLSILRLSLSNSCSVCCVCKNQPREILGLYGQGLTLTDRQIRYWRPVRLSECLELIHGRVAFVEEGLQIARDRRIGQEPADCAFAVLDADDKDRQRGR